MSNFLLLSPVEVLITSPYSFLTSYVADANLGSFPLGFQGLSKFNQ